MIQTADLKGLDDSSVADRRSSDGANVLPARRQTPPWQRFAQQLTHFFALMLWTAGILALVAGMPMLGMAIFVVVVVNAAFAFAQEYRAERAAEHLKTLLPSQVTVRRNGHPEVINATDLVTGDVVLLSGGDRVPADVEVVVAHALSADLSAFTGESGPVAIEQSNTLPGGAFVVEGEAETVVRATGARTRLAHIAELTRSETRPTGPLARELNRVVRIVAVIAVGVGALFWVVSLLTGMPSKDALIFAIGVTVALVPEGLLPTVTLSLAIGAQRMAARNALVRRLESVETLGSTTFICTDKTGTLTCNQMNVVDVWTPNGSATIDGTGYGPNARVSVDASAQESLEALARAAVICSNGTVRQVDGDWSIIGDPMEAALHSLALRIDSKVDVTALRSQIARRLPFDSKRRRMSVVTADEVIVKGAPDSVLSLCESGPPADVVESMTRRGLRVLAVASRPCYDTDSTATTDDAESGLTLLGIIGLQDPPRPDVKEALAGCRRAGIKVAMITGDHPSTARAIAEQVGLLGRDEIVLQGDALPDDDGVLGALLDHDGVVVSRITPEGKLRIARVLQQRGHVVAMTGDGVNDGPALQQADIGIAMGASGTDVAREAADLVLLNDHFGTIIAAVQLGRATFDNVRRFLTYHLTDNVAELAPFVIWALSGGRFPLALGVLQVVFLDIGTDLLPALALGAEPPASNVLDKPPPKRHLLDRSILGRVFGVLGPIEAITEMFAFLVAMWLAGWRPGDDFPSGHVLAAASGAAFCAVVFGQMANAFACRSSTEEVTRMRYNNPLLLRAVLFELCALIAFVFVSPVADLLDQAPPPAAAWLAALLAAPALLLADAAHKRWLRRS